MTGYTILLNNRRKRNELESEIAFRGGGIISKPASMPNILSVDISETLAKQYEEDNRVKIISKEEFGSVSSIQNITLTDNWALDRIDQRTGALDGKYNYVRTGYNADVYVFDSGINFNHVEFRGRAFPLFDGINDPVFPNGADSNGHGTHVSAIIAGTKFGVAKQARLYSVKVVGLDGRISDINILNAVNAVILHHNTKSNIRSSVANLSFEFPSRNPLIDYYIDTMIDEGIVVCVAAGNNRDDASKYSPAGIGDAITVAAVDQLDQFAVIFSNYGPKVDILAPGVNVMSAWPFDTTSVVLTPASPRANTVGVVPAGVKVNKIVIEVNEAFDRYPTLKIGVAPNFSLASLDATELSKVGYTKTQSVNYILAQNSEALVTAIFEQNQANTKGSATITMYIEKLSNSKSRVESGTSLSVSHVAGVFALRLEEEANKLSSREDVTAITQSIIELSLKNIVKHVPTGTPNRLIYAPWTKSNEVEWVTKAGNIKLIDEGDELSVTVNAIYYNNIGSPTSDITYSIVNAPSWGSNNIGIQIDPTSGEITWDGNPPIVSANETQTATIRATAPNSVYRDENFSITIVDTASEPPTWITPNKNRKVSRGKVTELPPVIEGVAYQPFDLHAVDPNTQNEVNNYSIISGALPEGLTLDVETGIISGSLSSRTLVDYEQTFTVRVTNASGSVSDRTFSIAVEADEVSPSWVTPEGSIGTSTVNSYFEFQLEAIDPDGDPIQYNLVSGSLPSGIGLNSETGLIVGIVLDIAGVYSFTVEATDTVLSTYQVFELEVQPASVNKPPSWLTPAGNLGSFDENEPVTLTLRAVDVDNDPITFTLGLRPGEAFPPGLVLSANGVISGLTSEVNIITTYTFTILISDGINNVVPRTFSLTIRNVSGVSIPEWITPAGSIGELWEFYPSTFKVEAADANNSEISYSIIEGALPSGLDLKINTGIIAGTPGTVGETSEHTFTVRASNGVFYVDREFSITIVNLLSVAVTKVLADRITGYDRIFIENYLDNIFSTDYKKELLYRAGDPEYAIPENFDIYLVNGLPILPPGAPEDADPPDEFYKVISDSIWAEENEYLNIVKNTDDNHPLDDGEERTLSSHNYKSTLFFNDIEIHHARDQYTGDILYDVLVVNITDPQANSSFRPDLLTFDVINGDYRIEAPDGKVDPGVAYPPEYDQPFQNPLMPTDIIVHPEADPTYDGSVLNNYGWDPTWPNNWNTAIPRNTESIDFVAPHSMYNMRMHIVTGYGGFVNDRELLPLWLGSEQEEGNPDSVIGWKPALVLAYLKPNTGQDLLDTLTTEQKNALVGYPITIDRHLVSTTPVLSPTTFFQDKEWFDGTKFDIAQFDTIILDQEEGSGDILMGTTTFDQNTTGFGLFNEEAETTDSTTFDDTQIGIRYDNLLTTFDLGVAPMVDCTFDDNETAFDSVGLELYTKYVKFPPGDKYWNAMNDTMIHKMKKQLPAIDTK